MVTITNQNGAFLRVESTIIIGERGREKEREGERKRERERQKVRERE